jgi:Glu-tRNA(Gln) amidotransferase subunit E-like FAD-binding protein
MSVYRQGLIPSEGMEEILTRAVIENKSVDDIIRGWRALATDEEVKTASLQVLEEQKLPPACEHEKKVRFLIGRVKEKLTKHADGLSIKKVLEELIHGD